MRVSHWRTIAASAEKRCGPSTVSATMMNERPSTSFAFVTAASTAMTAGRCSRTTSSMLPPNPRRTAVASALWVAATSTDRPMRPGVPLTSSPTIDKAPSTGARLTSPAIRCKVMPRRSSSRCRTGSTFTPSQKASHCASVSFSRPASRSVTELPAVAARPSRPMLKACAAVALASTETPRDSDERTQLRSPKRTVISGPG